MQLPSTFYDKLNRSLLSIVFIFLILYLAQHILIPVAFATLFALLLVSPCNFFERLGMLLLYYRGLIVRFFVTVFHPKHTGAVMEVLGKIRYVIKVYVLGLFIEMGIVAVMNCAGFLILGVKYAFLLGVIAALLNVIPYLGIFTACVISLLITSTTNTPGTVAGVGIVLLVVHLIDANIILPKVVGSKVKINVLATLLSVLVGSALWGIAGMFLFIPFIAIVKIIFDSVEVLNPWGLLLGEEPNSVAPKPERKWKKLFSRKNKKSNPVVK